MQHHIWLSTNAKTLLTLVPGGYPWVNFVVVCLTVTCYTLYMPVIYPLYTCIAIVTPMYTRYTCIYTMYTPNTPLNTRYTIIYTPP